MDFRVNVDGGWAGGITERDSGGFAAMDEFAIFAEALTEDQIKLVVSDGIASILAVEPDGKLPVQWGTLKTGL